MRILVVMAVLVVLLLLPASAHGALNKAYPFEVEYPFAEGLGGGAAVTLVSGAMDAQARSSTSSWGFFEATGFRITGLTRVCWEQSPNGCASGDLSIHGVGSVDAAFRFPVASAGRYVTAHSAALFIDFRFEEDLQGLGLGRSIVAPSADGYMVMAGPIGPFGTGVGIPTTQNSGTLVGITEATRFEVRRGNDMVAQVIGKDDVISFEGTASVPPFRATLAVLPFEAGASASFLPAAPAAVERGMNVTGISRALGEDPQGVQEDQESGVPAGMSALLTSLVVHKPAGGAGLPEILDRGAILRFTEVTARHAGGAVALQGKAPVQIQEGEVQHARPLLGFIPWWSIVLWVAAIGAFVARLVIKPPAKHETWDQFRWIGLVGGLVALIITLILWDNEVHALWGTSLLQDRAGGAALGVVAGLLFVPLAFVGLAVLAPLVILLSNGARLARQGTFMGLSKVVAPFLAFLIGARLMLDYVALLFGLVVGSLG